MKPGVVFPNQMAATLADAGALTEAGAQAIVAMPGAFVDESFNLTASPDDITSVCQSMEQAIIGTGGTDNVAIKDWMHSRQGDPVKTIMGDFVWDERGLPEARAFLVNQWQDGNLSLVYPDIVSPGSDNREVGTGNSRNAVAGAAR